MSEYGRIYIGSILLEMSRWTKEKQPTYRVSEWTRRLAEAGFDGIELWQWHATRSDDAERAALALSPCPVTIFNSYAAFDDSGAGDRRDSAELTRMLGAKAVKFNVGADPADRAIYIANLRQWRTMFDDDVMLLCECHPGTIIEEAADAKAFFDEAEVPGVGVIVHAFNRVDTLSEWMDTFGPMVRHAHLQMREGRDVIRLDGKGDAAEQAIGIMRAAGFDGSFTLEFTEGTLAPDESIDLLYTNALADLAFLKDLLI